MFGNKINKEYLKLSKIVYGGEFYLELKEYKLKEINIKESNFERKEDIVLSKKGNKNYYSYKNEKTGFVANLFENKKEIIIAYRGTERVGFGENISNINDLIKDILTDVDLVLGNYNNQFKDAWDFYKIVKKQIKNKKIKIVGQSLGGALAQIVAAKEYTINRNKIETYTFNAPGCRNLLEVYDCCENINYSFIKNYSVMNDWCGMFGNHIGERYLIKPIKIKETKTNSKEELLNNLLFLTHEGIFNYNEKEMGKIIKKPKEFNQKEGLSLWFFDENNPMNKYKNIYEFINANIPQLNINPIDLENNNFLKKAEHFFKEYIPQEIQNSNIAIAIKNKTEDIIEDINKNNISEFIKLLEKTFSELSLDSLNKANIIIKKYKF